jgi:hypothetical protein
MVILKLLGIVAIVILCFFFLTFSIAIGVKVGIETFFKHKEK